jgi:hypothetical protein
LSWPTTDAAFARHAADPVCARPRCSDPVSRRAPARNQAAPRLSNRQIGTAGGESVVPIVTSCYDGRLTGSESRYHGAVKMEKQTTTKDYESK